MLDRVNKCALGIEQANGPLSAGGLCRSLLMQSIIIPPCVYEPLSEFVPRPFAACSASRCGAKISTFPLNAPRQGRLQEKAHPPFETTANFPRSIPFWKGGVCVEYRSKVSTSGQLRFQPRWVESRSHPCDDSKDGRWWVLALRNDHTFPPHLLEGAKFPLRHCKVNFFSGKAQIPLSMRWRKVEISLSLRPCAARARSFDISFKNNSNN
jgi:hypothetical protein